MRIQTLCSEFWAKRNSPLSWNHSCFSEMQECHWHWTVTVNCWTRRHRLHCIRQQCNDWHSCVCETFRRIRVVEMAMKTQYCSCHRQHRPRHWHLSVLSMPQQPQMPPTAASPLLCHLHQSVSWLMPRMDLIVTLPETLWLVSGHETIAWTHHMEAALARVQPSVDLAWQCLCSIPWKSPSRMCNKTRWHLATLSSHSNNSPWLPVV